MYVCIWLLYLDKIPEINYSVLRLTDDIVPIAVAEYCIGVAMQPIKVMADTRKL